MTYGGEPGQEVDLDLLADYIGGALDGTPEAASVERLIGADPAWAHAYVEMSTAMESVRADLSALEAAGPERMPAGVALQLEAALAREAPRRVPPAEAEKVGRLASPRRRIASRAAAWIGLSQTKQSRTKQSWAERGWSRRLGPIAVAMAVLIFAGAGGTLLNRELTRPHDKSASGLSRDQAPSAPQRESSAAPAAAAPNKAGGADAGSNAAQAQAEAAEAPIYATGTDYRGDLSRLTLPRDASSALGRASVDASKARAGADASAVPEQLRRLTEPSAISACLAAIRSEHGQPAATVSLVDLARYEESPAVIVLLAEPGGAEWVWVAGPDCGTAGADTRGHAQIR